MIFREFALDECEGVLLAHTLKLGPITLKKGRRLGARDIEALSAAGVGTVAGARLEPDDLDEDAAAAAVAGALGGEHVAARRPYTGRCNLHASGAGVLVVDAVAIDRINALDEAITVGTLPAFAPAHPAQVVATVKIIPFAVERRLVEAVRAIAAEAPPIRIEPYSPRRGALILTELPGTRDNATRAAISATRHRLEALGSRLAFVTHCTHDAPSVAAALGEARAAGCELLLIAGATVTKDRMDVVPSGIVKAGGEVIHFGMPVEPGNMILLARLGDIPVVNLPGCARSRRANGLDWVLQRLHAGLPLGRREITGMGVGGLIRSPLEPEDEEEDDAAQQTPERGARGAHVAALVLAAGSSRRMGGANKLLEPIGGIPMVRRVANAALASRCASVTVVTGHEAEQVRAALAGRELGWAHNAEFGRGLSSSLHCGLRALPDEARAVVVLLGDMPRITATHLDRLVDRFDPADPHILVPVHAGRRGNPVLWPREHFEAMQAIEGDVGARALIERFADRVERVAFDDDAIFLDVDTPDALAGARQP